MPHKINLINKIQLKSIAHLAIERQHFRRLVPPAIVILFRKVAAVLHGVNPGLNLFN